MRKSFAWFLRCPSCKRWGAMTTDQQKVVGEKMVRQYLPISRKTARGRMYARHGSYTLNKRTVIEETRQCRYCGCLQVTTRLS